MTPLLEISGLAKRFGKLTVIDDLSFTVAPGEALGVVGPNGAGKSTMLNLVNGVLRPDEGTIRFAGTDVTRIGADRRCRAGIGRSYQIPRPFGEMTVFGNALVGATLGAGLRGRHAHRAAFEALERTELMSLANSPAGALRLLDRKRLELARAMACGPRLILLDEIAGGLTDSELPTLVDTVRGLRDSGVAVIWIEHIVHALLAVVDRLMCLTYGTMLAIGDPQAVMRDPEVVTAYLGHTVERAS
ncbi:ABC transporter ATP-binding protein [Lentzea aerocolonigenes]|uniref:ABC transporter ATP-binding protein n=1 Tax=Lentzea aerocolonigenes TaxID=68170 RepID=A0A0F0H2W0_LENAE|nr:ABC transporter ATP-binding protein [Lentzea aerocolonigenes]KJK48617.1 ABC transporter ATP-binding protein [Lentzea aerocolonigenes]